MCKLMYGDVGVGEVTFYLTEILQIFAVLSIQTGHLSPNPPMGLPASLPSCRHSYATVDTGQMGSVSTLLGPMSTVLKNNLKLFMHNNTWQRHYVFRYSMRLSIRPSINDHFSWCGISELSGWSSKLARNIHQASANCWKGFQGQRSTVKVMIRINATTKEACISTVWQRGWRTTC